ncbi:MAG: VCBS repeat-containing protein, partial [Actinomycetota bacterium]
MAAYGRSDFNGDGRRDLLIVTPRGDSGLNFQVALSSGSGFSDWVAWANTGSNYTLDQVKLFAGDFNHDGFSDIGIVTPRGDSGLNFQVALSNGSGFSDWAVWYDTGTDHTLDQIRLFAGDFNHDRLSDIGLVTPRGASGLNFVPLLSTGTSFTHGGVWANTGSNYTLDQVKLFAGDFNHDGFSDIGIVTPRGDSGL